MLLLQSLRLQDCGGPQPVPKLQPRRWPPDVPLNGPSRWRRLIGVG